MAKSKTATATKASTKTTKKTKTATKAKPKAKAKAAPKAKSTAKTKPAKKVQSPQELALMDETGRRKTTEKPKVERRKRRRQIDPTTCEREYTDPEIQFMHAMDEYKRASGRMFPTCSEILEVLARLGYRQIETPLDSMYEVKSEKKEDIEDWDQEDDDV